MLSFLGPVGAFIQGNKLISGLIGVLAFLVIVMGSYFLGSHNGRAAQADHDAKATLTAINKAVTENTARLEQASAQRRLDDAAVASRTKGLSDVVANIPDAPPTRRGVALTCERLRLAGHPYSDFPECAGLVAPGQAAPKR